MAAPTSLRRRDRSNTCEEKTGSAVFSAEVKTYVVYLDFMALLTKGNCCGKPTYSCSNDDNLQVLRHAVCVSLSYLCALEGGV